MSWLGVAQVVLVEHELEQQSRIVGFAAACRVEIQELFFIVPASITGLRDIANEFVLTDLLV